MCELLQQNGLFQKLSLPYQGWLFVIPRAVSGGGGGGLNWKFEGVVRYLGLEFEGMRD